MNQIAQLYWDLQQLHSALLYEKKNRFDEYVSKVRLSADLQLQCFEYQPTEYLRCLITKDTIVIDINGIRYPAEFTRYTDSDPYFTQFVVILARAIHYTGNASSDILQLVGPSMLPILVAHGHVEEVKTWKMK
jgi:hypothetical protein